ncbi:dethiobiotin synthase [Helicobacter sp. 12S02232-10]|uniref:dethiobiotin synthase n=1 Tax=Helicobacter sp. 12S02232-10 TaxID=1476197 RepID=UPI000BA6A597|nr:dethiobiotin synthase [Helicobacter sp. 12S02232-10]PAF49627.1 dethiobiotin synthase [Helicobacter sp. 12S02232-10]
MKTLFISATNTNIGKTYTATLLSDYCNQMGIKTLVAKPIETGDEGGILPDCHIHLHRGKKVFPDLSLDDINFYRYHLPASPFVAQLSQPQAPKVDFEYIKQKIGDLGLKCDFLIIEGAGGIMVPIDGKRNMFDLAQYLESPMLLVSGDRLGMINDLLLNRAFLESKDIFCTYAVNTFDFKSYEKISKPYIDYLNQISQNQIYHLQSDISQIVSKIFSFYGN